LIVAKRDRLARDVMLSCWIEKEVKRRGARIISAAGEGTESDDPTNVLLRNIVDAFAQYERDIIAARTAAAMAQKKARGEKTGGEVPFGYSLADDGIHLEREAAEVEALGIISELRRRGYSLRQIAAELQARGIQTKKGNTTWQPKVISKILKRAA
jgi:DNA invertase Pin-like site-specific DNA recombinase